MLVADQSPTRVNVPGANPLQVSISVRADLCHSCAVAIEETALHIHGHSTAFFLERFYDSLSHQVKTGCARIDGPSCRQRIHSTTTSLLQPLVL